MCGITGIIDLNKSTPESKRNSLVQKMNQAIFHRGPDGDGSYSDDYASLAMRRLSIIDLEGGWQPLYNKAKTILTFMNGEIYNYQELRNDLITKGHTFQTNSDTEVIPHLYEEYGQELPKYLKGMFAFVVYDIPQKTWFFARDRFGEKPFFYHFKNGEFSFSSEFGSLLENENIPRQLNEEALPYYLHTTLIPDPMTMVRNVYSLPPGNTLLLNDAGIQVKPYFNPSYKVNSELKSLDDAINFIQPKLEKAVQRQMISDVPLGAFLSGGIDSSTVVALLQKQSTKKIKTFTVRFEDSGYDESPIAREVANQVGTDHHEITVPNQDFSEEIFWDIIEHTGVPFADSSAIPSFLITKEIRQHVTVALSGDGGDELFGGYPVYQWWGKINRTRKIPKIIRKPAANTLNALRNYGKLPGQNLLRKLGRLLEVTNHRPEATGRAIHAMFTEKELGVLKINKDFSAIELDNDSISGLSDIRTAMLYRLKFNLPLDMLTKVDRMSMANSLEVRAPFLDPDLFEASAQLPDKFLIQNGNGKYLIREIMKPYLPDSVFNHPKTGFSIPLHHYFNEDFKRLCDSLLINNKKVESLLGRDLVHAIVKDGLTLKKNTAKKTVYKSSHQLWTLLMLAGWIKRFEILV